MTKNTKQIDMERQDIIKYIITHDEKIDRKTLESLRYESLILIKVQIELELDKKRLAK